MTVTDKERKREHKIPKEKKGGHGCYHLLVAFLLLPKSVIGFPLLIRMVSPPPLFLWGRGMITLVVL